MGVWVSVNLLQGSCVAVVHAHVRWCRRFAICVYGCHLAVRASVVVHTHTHTHTQSQSHTHTHDDPACVCVCVCECVCANVSFIHTYLVSYT
jgi:hypothetical protein